MFLHLGPSHSCQRRNTQILWHSEQIVELFSAGMFKWILSPPKYRNLSPFSKPLHLPLPPPPTLPHCLSAVPCPERPPQSSLSSRSQTPKPCLLGTSSSPMHRNVIYLTTSLFCRPEEGKREEKHPQGQPKKTNSIHLLSLQQEDFPPVFPGVYFPPFKEHHMVVELRNSSNYIKTADIRFK